MIFPQTLKNLPGSGTVLVLEIPATFLRHCHTVVPGMGRPSDCPGFALSPALQLGNALSRAEMSFQWQLQHTLTLTSHA